MQKTAPYLTASASANPARLRLLEGNSSTSSPRVSLSLDQIERLGQDWISEAQYLLHSPRTIESKRDIIAKLLWWMRTFEYSEVGAREVRLFLAYVGQAHERPEGRWGNPHMKRPVTMRTIHTYFGQLRAFFCWLERDGLGENVMAGFAVPLMERHQVQPFSPDHLAALMRAARSSTHPKRDEALLLFMLDTGVRASELCALKISDVELHGSYGTARVLGKGRKFRSVPFSRRAARALWVYLREVPRKDSEPLFLSDRGVTKGAAITRSGLLQIFERLGKAAGIQNVRCSPHTMRHTFAISFLRGGGNTFTLQQILGHTNLQMTQRYVAIAQADIEAQHRQFSPADRLGR